MLRRGLLLADIETCVAEGFLFRMLARSHVFAGAGVVTLPATRLAQAIENTAVDLVKYLLLPTLCASVRSLESSMAKTQVTEFIAGLAECVLGILILPKSLSHPSRQCAGARVALVSARAYKHLHRENAIH